MKKNSVLIGMAVVVAILGAMVVSAVAFAQGPVAGSGTGTPYGQGLAYQDADGDGVCDNFIDENGDGVCDLLGTYGGGRMGRWGTSGAAMGAYGGAAFVDANGDGVCDNFVDADGDGISDLMGTLGGMRGRMGGRWAAPQAQ